MPDRFLPPPSIRGLLVPGNIDVAHRPTVLTPDGSIATVYSESSQDDQGREVLYPSVVKDNKGGYIVDPEKGWDAYARTGQHLGIFDTPAHADRYAESLHEGYENGDVEATGRQNLYMPGGQPIEPAISHKPDPMAVFQALVDGMKRR